MVFSYAKAELNVLADFFEMATRMWEEEREKLHDSFG